MQSPYLKNLIDMAKVAHKQELAQQSITPVYEAPSADLLDFYNSIAEMLANDYLKSKQD